MELQSNLHDEELLLEFQKGNLTAYEAIYHRYWKLLYRHALSMLRNEEEAKDVVQDVFTMLWTRLQSAPITTPLAPFLYCSTRNNILNRVKHLKVKAKFNEHVQYAFDNLTELPDGVVLQKELAGLIDDGTQSMPSKMREIFIMSRNEHLSHKEISEKLNISDKTVKRQISNALNILRVKLALYKLSIISTFIYIL